MRAILVFFLTTLRRFLRDPVYLFFMLAFPLIFLFIFGTIFGGNGDISFKVALLNHSNSEFAKTFTEKFTGGDNNTFEADQEVKDLAAAKEKMARGELDSIIELPANFGAAGDNHLPAGEVQVYYDPGKTEAGQTVATVIGGIMDEINIEMTGIEPPLSVKQVSTGQAGMSQFDYTFAGLFAYTLMTMSIYGLSNQLPSEKKTGALRRIKATPFKPWQLIIGLALVYFVLTAISATLMCVIGAIFFDWQMKGSWPLFIAFGSLSVLMLSGFGMLIAGAAKNENQSSMASQLIAFPMMFLSGVFFPLFIMPEIFQTVSKFIPLTPVAEGLRFIATEGIGFIELLPQIGLVAAWGVAVYLIAFKVFRWE